MKVAMLLEREEGDLKQLGYQVVVERWDYVKFGRERRLYHEEFSEKGAQDN